MRAVVVYESMYGNTRHVAEAVARGLGGLETVKVVSVSAAFDTRYAGTSILTGRASRGIANHLRASGFTMLAPAESFVVRGKDTLLLPGEELRAEAWGRNLAEQLGAVP